MRRIITPLAWPDNRSAHRSLDVVPAEPAPHTRGVGASGRHENARFAGRPTGHSRYVFTYTKRPGRRGNVRFMPGCLIWSLVLSVVLTVLLNVIVRAF